MLALIATAALLAPPAADTPHTNGLAGVVVRRRLHPAHDYALRVEITEPRPNIAPPLVVFRYYEIIARDRDELKLLAEIESEDARATILGLVLEDGRGFHAVLPIEIRRWDGHEMR